MRVWTAVVVLLIFKAYGHNREEQVGGEQHCEQGPCEEIWKLGFADHGMLLHFVFL